MMFFLHKMDCGVLGQLKWETSVGAGGREEGSEGGRGEGAEGCSGGGLRGEQCNGMEGRGGLKEKDGMERERESEKEGEMLVIPSVLIAGI